jgi:N-acetyl-alpha-D-muramate 1-phosphate uridylyltransferase
MQVVILAGGLGTRLWPLTKEVPKPMVPVAGVPYLERQLQLLARQELRNVLILTAYLGEQIECYFGDGSRLGLSIRYSREREPLGTGGALREARALLDEVFVVIYGDSYLPIDYGAVGRRLAISGKWGGLVVYHDPSGETGVRRNLALSTDGLVTRYDKTAIDDPELHYIEAGVLALRRQALALAPPQDKFSLEQELFPSLIARKALLGFPTQQRFYDIGTMERLKAIEQLFA